MQPRPQTRKEFAKANKISKSADKFNDLLNEVSSCPRPIPLPKPAALRKHNVTCHPTTQVPDQFKAELIMVRLSLLEGVGEPQKKRGSKLSQEIDGLCTWAVNLQPCWVRAAPPPPSVASDITTPLP